MTGLVAALTVVTLATGGALLARDAHLWHVLATAETRSRENTRIIHAEVLKTRRLIAALSQQMTMKGTPECPLSLPSLTGP